MTQTSSVNTLAATTGMSAATSLVEWLANSKMHMAMPPEVVLTIAAGLVTLSHFLANVINSALTEDGLPTLAQFVPFVPSVPTTVTHQTGFARLPILFGLVAIAAACLTLSGCGTVDAWVAGKTNIVEQDYKGARANVKRQDDDVLQLWLDTSCDVKVGALARNPEALTPVMAACPVSGMAKVNTTNGNISLSVPNSLPLVQAQTVTTPVATTSTTPAAANATQQTMNSILTTLQTIQNQTAPAPVTKTQPVKKATTPAPIAKPSASITPATVTPSVAMPVVSPTPAPVAAQPATPAETQMRSFLSAPRTAPSN